MGRAPPSGRYGGPVTLAELIARWRAEAELLDAHHAAEAAATKRRDADELEEALLRRDLEELTPTEAAREKGCDPSTIRRHFPGRKTIRRAELSGKGTAGGPDLAGELL